MKKVSILLLVVVVLTTLCLSGIASANENPKIIYQTDFEGVSISESNTADNATGFVWVNRWQDAVTERHNGSNMLKAPLYDNATYSILGGLGIASRSNLALCDPGESYEATLYMEMHGLEFMFVEFVGGDNKWGSVIIYPDGTVTNNGSGDNMCEVSYINNVLKFKFTMSEPFNEGGNMVNGYIKFTGYNCSNAYVYIDDISIVKSDSTYSEDFTEHSIGTLDTLDSKYFGKFYSTSTTEIVEKSGNKYLKVSKMPTGLEGTDMFFLNRLMVLNRGRDYKVSLDLSLENVNKLYVYNVGDWNTPMERMEITPSTGEISINGTVMSNVVYKDGKLTFDFRASTEYKEYCQFQFIAEPISTNTPIVINVDNIEFLQVPIVTKIDVHSISSRLEHGKDLDLSNFIVTALYSDGSKQEIDTALCTVTGYDKNVEGYQVITFTYNGISTQLLVDVVRDANTLRLDISNVKTEYAYGEDLDLSGLIVYAEYQNGESKQLENDPICKGYSICYGEFDKYTPGTYTITVTYGSLTQSFEITVLPSKGVDFGNVQYTPM